jgi:hypothetical protein
MLSFKTHNTTVFFELITVSYSARQKWLRVDPDRPILNLFTLDRESALDRWIGVLKRVKEDIFFFNNQISMF